MKPFWHLPASASAPAVIETATGGVVTYGRLADAADAAAEAWRLPPARGLVFVFARNDLASLSAYLGALRAGHALALLPVAALAQAGPLLSAYAPDRIVAPAGLGPLPGYRPAPGAHDGQTVWHPAGPPATETVHEDLALLLSTSGTTGSPKMVRLSHANLQANATAIRDYLGLTPAERAPTTLPLSYSYGLSVVNSHLAAGATLLLGDFPVVQQDTWAGFSRLGATSFAGVPLLYQQLRRLRFDPSSQPTLRTYTQAGGRLAADTKLWLLEALGDHARLFVMYGQTEATARISYVPPDLLRAKLDSIGRAIPGGELRLDPATRELVYRGPNVMLGYAESRGELAAGDVLRGELRTGDLGRRDDDGFYYIEGRIKRFLKLAGLRVGLDELERRLEARFGCAVACGGRDEGLRVHCEGDHPAQAIAAALREEFGLHPSLATIRSGTPLARLPTGKIDYAALLDD